MQQMLLIFYNSQIKAFNENFEKVREGFGFDAVHDMRVAIKRLRVVIILCEELDPELSIINDKEELRKLFRLSGKMRDAQVQQGLVREYEFKLEVDFGKFSGYLLNYERKAIKKFNNYCTHHNPHDFILSISTIIPKIITTVNEGNLKSAFYELLKKLFNTIEFLKTHQLQDEHLHEIRGILKQCNYLLSIFNTEGNDLPQLASLLKKLEKVNELLGKWHDHVIMMEFLSGFLKNKDIGESSNYKHYSLLIDQISEEKLNLYLRITDMLEKPMDKLFPSQDFQNLS
jgi:CHAD domain-containing protein